MLRGFGGHLISEAFLESHLRSQAGDPARTAGTRARLDRWHRQSRTLGPATTVRALLEIGAAPLFDALGFDGACRIGDVDDRAAAALVTSGRRALTLVVGSWGEPLDRLWRIAVTHAVRHGADWCFLFNGTRLRIVDAVRLHSRRHVEFDLDLALDDDRTLSALCCLAS